MALALMILGALMILDTFDWYTISQRKDFAHRIEKVCNGKGPHDFF